MAVDTHVDRGQGLRGLTPPESVRGPGGLALLLREQTAEHHRRAEGADFQRLLFAGQLPLEQYVRWLEQLRAVHKALEARLWLNWDSPAWRELTAPDRRRSVQLEQDLLSLGRTLPAEPSAVTQRFLAQLAALPDDPPAALLGALYVLEGSSNGSRMMARGLRAAYKLPDVEGTRNLDPYGEAQPVRWKAFRAALDEALPESAWPAALDGARTCFEAITQLGEELLPRAAG